MTDIYSNLRSKIVNNLTQVKDVLDILLSRECITTSNYEAINSVLPESGKIRNMLEILQKRKCPYKIFMEILLSTDNKSLAECFQKEIEKLVVLEKAVEEKTEKRKIFIVEGTDIDEKLHDRLTKKHPDWDLCSILGSYHRVKDKIIEVPQNDFKYFDVIVLCDDQLNDIKNDSLKEMIPYIKKELLPIFLTSIVTFLIVVDDDGDTSYYDTSDSQLVNVNDTQDSQPVITVLKKKCFNKFKEGFFKSEEMFNIYVRKAGIRKELSLQVY